MLHFFKKTRIISSSHVDMKMKQKILLLFDLLTAVTFREKVQKNICHASKQNWRSRFIAPKKK